MTKSMKKNSPKMIQTQNLKRKQREMINYSLTDLHIVIIWYLF